ncbi:elongation factor 1-gamma (EF-1-gamma) [Trypanosoma rangeli]|uniref:Elongation factor 1-gamma (EF-1-gamma) n=1 Tax=Trypanosoma rangeli TaxID=5698 RepID=A0A3R7MZA1_TRYRA|nr:elongation factor 1-gamma (EF-1-gamma) [Trypanosoma rangeli]RNE97543.1 elongation factor 1-gamma (EF-1-gamma) [Trypanosoma rangeli]|eukprot:RNE97543.1 elongation factor 1-gamma (EF-1-gamma) [Trypanosoma rangeli]
MVLSLIGPLDNPEVQRVLLVATYAGTQLKVVPVTLNSEKTRESYRRNCHPLGRVPVLKSDEGYLFETNAIIRHLARTERPYGVDGGERHPSPQHVVPYILYGKSLREAAEVDAWLDFVLTEVDPYFFPLLAAEREERKKMRNSKEEEGVGAMARQPLVDALREGLNGLEQRLVFKKQLRKLAMGGGGASNNPLSARTGTQEEVDEELSEDEYLIAATPRESAMLRGYHTYNIKTHVEEPEVSNSANSSEGVLQEAGTGAPSPRSSGHPPRPPSYSPRRSASPPSDMIFLVGDSLTAADLVLALAVNQVLSLRQVGTALKQHCPHVVRYHHSILRLPLATELRKVLGINVV